MNFDTHTHVNFDAFKNDADQTVKRALDAGTWMINVGTQLDTSKSAVALAEKYSEGVYAAIGLHPAHTFQHMMDEEESHFKSRQEHFDTSMYQSMITDKVVAIGECGLDYFRLENSNKEQVISKQKTEFIKQIAFAKKHKLTLVIHCRDAYEDLLEILKVEYQGLPAIIHSYTGEWETAKKFIDLGYYIALNGILTFAAPQAGRASPIKDGRDKRDLVEVCKNTPLDKLLSETDAPYLAPPPYRGKRNEPLYVKYVVQKIAEIRGLDLQTVENQLFQNALKVYNIKM